jgi:hypothetical protein
MIKPLNMLNNYIIGVPSAGLADLRLHESSALRVALGFAGVAMTVITIAISVILPAQLSGSRQPHLLLAGQATPPASNGVAITSITVIAAREPRSATAPRRIVEAASSPAPFVETASSAILRVSSAAQ